MAKAVEICEVLARVIVGAVVTQSVGAAERVYEHMIARMKYNIKEQSA